MAAILVVEDDDLIRTEVVQWLQFENHEVLSASNGRDGIRIALDRRPDLIISDIVMPEADGYRFLLELRISPSTALIPFIFMTAKADRRDLRYGMELGADDYISKPFTHQELLRAIERRLQRRTTYQTTIDMQIAEVKRTFLRTLSHELRTPLVGVLGVGELLTQNAESLNVSDIIEYGQLLTTSAHRLYHLIENFLLFTKLESDENTRTSTGHTAMLPAHETINVIREASEQAAADYHRKADLHADIQACVIYLDADALRKITHELVDNAFKFSAAHQSVLVTGRIVENTFVLRVSDQGHGIAAENIARIAPYIQFDRAIHEQQGLGLGLSIVTHLVNRVGGRLTIESDLGKGTLVTVMLPIS